MFLFHCFRRASLTSTASKEIFKSVASLKAMTNDLCSICLEDYNKGDADTTFIAMVKVCKHYFHFECLWRWLELHSSCPLCRESARLTEKDIKGTSLAQVNEGLARHHENVPHLENDMRVEDISSRDILDDINEDNQTQDIQAISSRNRRTTCGISESTLPGVHLPIGRS
jgi:hypothetical protein